MTRISLNRMNKGEFAIRSSREAQAFQHRLARYRKERCGGTELLRPGYLRDLHAWAERSGANRLFTAVYDLEITFLFVEKDIRAVAGTHNRQFAPGRPYESSVPLFDDGAFAGKMDTLEHLTAFALRCRAFWDKVMGVLFLLCEPAKYESFAKASRRKRYFVRCAENWPEPPPHLIRFLESPDFRGFDPDPQFPQILEKVMEHLDAIRTAEAHGTGTLRKSTLGTLRFEATDQASLVAHYNIALGTMKALRQTLDDRACGSAEK